MKKGILVLCFLSMATFLVAQTGHVMQGIGATNMSMGGAATGQPLDASGALYWNPASISKIDQNQLRFDLGFFFSSPSLSSSLPAGMLGPGAPAVSGTTEDSRGMSPMPALSAIWGKPDSKHKFGASLFGVSGFGVTFEEEANNPLSQDFNPLENSNPINYPQQAMGFGRIESNYMLMQVGFTWSYQLTDKFSLGVQPLFNYAGLELMPNPTANPNQTGYPSTNNATALGFGAQFGVFYGGDEGFKAGLSYKTKQSFDEFEFENTYLDGSTGESTFEMNYPAIASVGLGYSKGEIDLALDYRNINYEGAEGFNQSGWSETASVKGFGWEDVNVVSFGIQYKGLEKFPLRLGYTYSSNPISSEMAFFNVPATAIVENAFQLGFSFDASQKLSLDAMYHYGMSNGETSGPMYNPQMISEGNPLGAIPGSEVGYDMTTSMFMVGARFKLGN